MPYRERAGGDLAGTTAPFQRCCSPAGRGHQEQAGGLPPASTAAVLILGNGDRCPVPGISRADQLPPPACPRKLPSPRWLDPVQQSAPWPELSSSRTPDAALHVHCVPTPSATRRTADAAGTAPAGPRPAPAWRCPQRRDAGARQALGRATRGRCPPPVDPRPNQHGSGEGHRRHQQRKGEAGALPVELCTESSPPALAQPKGNRQAEPMTRTVRAHAPVKNTWQKLFGDAVSCIHDPATGLPSGVRST